jgi:hypothetical protein
MVDDEHLDRRFLRSQAQSKLLLYAAVTCSDAERPVQLVGAGRLYRRHLKLLCQRYRGTKQHAGDHPNLIKLDAVTESGVGTETFECRSITVAVRYKPQLLSGFSA